MKTRIFFFILLLSLSLNDCSGKKSIGLDVDVYLHPEAAMPDDLLLQTAIRKRLKESPITHLAALHVRVVDRIVFLDGSAKSDAISNEAIRIAESTQVNVNGESIETKDAVRNRIKIEN